MMAFESLLFPSSASTPYTLSLIAFQRIANDSSNTQIDTEPCTIKHWQSIPDVERLYTEMNMGSWQCLSLQSRLSLRGSGSNRKDYAQIRIACPACGAGQATQVTVHLMNSMVNLASQDNFLPVGIESRNFVVLQNKLETYLTIQPQSYTAYTGLSPFPWASDQVSTGSIIT